MGRKKREEREKQDYSKAEMLKCFKLIGLKFVKVKECTVTLKIIIFFKVIKVIKVFFVLGILLHVLSILPRVLKLLNCPCWFLPFRKKI